MLLLNFAGTAAMAVTATLTATSCRNMLQTYQEASLSSPSASADDYNDIGFGSLGPPSAVEALECLKQLNRKELLQVYLFESETPPGEDPLVDSSASSSSSSSAAASLTGGKDASISLLDKQIGGEWNGMLLENNGIIMTAVARFMTNALFGNNRVWNGKVFGLTNRQARGTNRFDQQDDDATATTTTAPTTEQPIGYDHYFDYQVEPSLIAPTRLNSIVLRYGKYQTFDGSGWKSLLWNSMVDELRIIQCANGECVLIGLGCMAWSGGIWNGTPFCLVRPETVAAAAAAASSSNGLHDISASDTTTTTTPQSESIWIGVMRIT